MTDRGASPWPVIIHSFPAPKGRQNLLLVQYQLYFGLCRPLGAFFVVASLPGANTPVCVLSSLRDFTSRTPISVESESSVSVCFMNTDCTDSPDFSVFKAKPFVLFVKFVVFRTPTSVESESSVFVYMMTTDCTDPPDFSVSKAKPFVLFVQFVVGPIFCFMSEPLMDKSVADKMRCF